MPLTAAGPRVLLRQLREVMAAPESAQARLDRIVVAIAANMVAEVCSIYLMRPDGRLELFATEGLNPDAVHKTTMRVGEGLVGLIAETAEPLNLSEAWSHPSFSYRPETGEETYRSFLGVPILRGGRALGVLDVQNRTERHYEEEEVEALQTIAVVLAEIVASGELAGVGRPDEEDQDHVRSHLIEGTGLADGVALGHAVLHEPRISVTNLIAEDITREQIRLKKGLEALRDSIDRMLSMQEIARGGEHREVLETYRMLARDRGWAHRIGEAIATGLTAEAAVERVQNDARARMLRQRDPYLRERLHDLDDLANRLLRHLTGRIDTAAAGDLPADSIIFARNMGPAELLDYDRSKVRGLVLEEGGPSSHVAIVAKALEIPMVGRAGGILDLVDPDDPVIADGESGEVYIRPTADVEEAYADKARFRARQQARFAKLRDKPARTRDGQDVELLINAGLLVDLPHLEEAGAAGIGLFRTELQFMVSSTFPRLNAQAKLYGAILNAAGDRPVVFRSLDIGGDKVLPYLNHSKEPNPALGWRAIRMALDRPGLLRLQIRALLRAAAGRDLNVMFPMIAEVDEFIRAKAMVEREVSFMKAHGHERPQSIRLGAMIEVPSIIWQLDALLPLVDFISVGSNDLLQFMFASDRDNPRLAGRYDPLSPSVLKLLRHIVERAEAAGTSLTICGELAGRPLEAIALIALGYRSISMAPAGVGPIKAALMELDVSDLEPKLLERLDGPEHSLRAFLESYAKDHNIAL